MQQGCVEIPTNVIPALARDEELYFATKRAFDVIAAMILLIVLAPVMAVVALAIRLDSQGSVLFRQDRVGARRRRVAGQTVWEPHVFRICKFRSMYRDADQRVHQAYIKAFVSGQLQATEDAASFKLKSDPRVTRVGAVLRKTSLDELPQLFNVLTGEMSLVGPRPVPVYEVEGYRPWHFERLAATPGITGYWQVFGRGRVTFEEMVAMDIEYVRGRSFLVDLKLLLKTVPAVVAGRGAA